MTSLYPNYVALFNHLKCKINQQKETNKPANVIFESPHSLFCKIVQGGRKSKAYSKITSSNIDRFSEFFH